METNHTAVDRLFAKLTNQIETFTTGKYLPEGPPVIHVVYTDSKLSLKKPCIPIKKTFDTYPEALLKYKDTILFVDSIDPDDRIKIHHLSIFNGAITSLSEQTVSSDTNTADKLRIKLQALHVLRSHRLENRNPPSTGNWISLLKAYDNTCESKDWRNFVKSLLEHEVSPARIHSFIEFLIHASIPDDFCLNCFYDINDFLSQRFTSAQSLTFFSELVETMTELLDQILLTYPKTPEYYFQKCRVSIILNKPPSVIEHYWQLSLTHNIPPSRISYLLWTAWFFDKTDCVQTITQKIPTFEEESLIETHLLWMTLALIGNAELAFKHYHLAISRFPHLGALTKTHPFCIQFPIEMLAHSLDRKDIVEKMRAQYNDRFPQLLYCQEQQARAVQAKSIALDINLDELI